MEPKLGVSPGQRARQTQAVQLAWHRAAQPPALARPEVLRAAGQALLLPSFV